MKKLILILTILLTISTAYSANENFENKNSAYKALSESNIQYNDICRNVTKHFKADFRFSSYIRNRCILFETGREQLLGIIYSYPNPYIKGFNKEYPMLYSGYAIKMNNEDIEKLKEIVTEYCKYNQGKLKKKAPQACSPEAIEHLFGQ